MTLSFSTEINGKPTHFVEKIWESIFQRGIEIKLSEFAEMGPKALPENYIIGTHNPKIHSIRQDNANRWEAGNKIHMVINNRTPDRFQFAPVIECSGVQEIATDPLTRSVAVGVEFRLLSRTQILQLAINDGFDSAKDFWAYFNEPFKGKIIHWTDHRYE